MSILLVALAPVIIILIYIYVRDKYEKEPLPLLIKSLALGALIVIPVVFVEGALKAMMPVLSSMGIAFYDAFVVAAFTEESFKFMVFYLLIRKNHEFDERFDGIVYAVFISLGFAGVENIMYVFDGGMGTGIFRAFTAVPAHALFGVSMGYYFALSKFVSKNTRLNLFKALAVPVVLHGIYDFILMTGHPYLLLAFFPFLIYLWWSGMKKIKHGY